MGKIFVACLIFVQLIYLIPNVKSDNQSESPTISNSEETFVATNEWQVIPEGQGIPPGLHVRIDMQTGKKEAKLLDETEKPVQSSSALIRTVSEEEPEEISTSIDYSVLEEALKKIKNDGGSGSSADSTIYRSYEEIKEEMKKVEQSIKTEYEIVKDLVSSYMKLEEDPEKESILNDLEFYVHQYDNAQDFVMMGGFKNVVLPALNSSSPALRSSAAFLLGSACQSNPKAQIAAIEIGSLPQLIRLVSFDSSQEVRSRALYAISCVIRYFPLAQKALVEHGGLTAFANIFRTDSADLVKLQLKIVTLLSDIILEKNMVHDNVKEHHKWSETTPIDKDTLEKLRQYDAANVEQVLIEQGFCGLFPRLLTSLRHKNEQTPDEDLSSVEGLPFREEHDIVEKVVQAMLILTRPCRTEFKFVGGLIQSLGERYHKLSDQERTELNSKSELDQDSNDLYYSKIHGMCQQLWNELDQRDEL